MAGWPPKRAVALDLVVVIRDADGDPITDPTGLAGVISKDKGAQAATVNTPAVVSAGSAMVGLTLTLAEVTADLVAVVISSTSAGAKSAFVAFYTDTSQIRDIATPAQVNAEVIDALNVDTYAEPAQGTPPATATLVQRLQYLYKSWRNRTTQDATTYKLFNDDTVTVGHKAVVSDDLTTFDKGEVGTGP